MYKYLYIFQCYGQRPRGCATASSFALFVLLKNVILLKWEPHGNRDLGEGLLAPLPLGDNPQRKTVRRSLLPAIILQSMWFASNALEVLINTPSLLLIPRLDLCLCARMCCVCHGGIIQVDCISRSSLRDGQMPFRGIMKKSERWGL